MTADLVPIDKASLDILYNEKEADIEHLVASAIGCLMYLVVTTRPWPAVGEAAQQMSKPDYVNLLKVSLDI